MSNLILKMFDIDFNLLAVRILPAAMRGEKFVAWAKTLVKPLTTFHVTFKAYVDDTLFYVRHTGSKLSMEHALNTLYPLAGGDIYIKTLGANLAQPYIYKLSESTFPIYIYKLSESTFPAYIYKLSELGLNGNDYDFIVWVPVALTFDEDKMRAVVDRYKLAGIRYDIQTY